MSDEFFYNILIPVRFRKINEKTLKIFATVTMIIDHIGLGFLLYYIYANHGFTGYSMERSNDIYMIFRIIGRSSFPVFCFMIVEGLMHTRNRKHYLGMMILFSIISELPFDLAFQTSYKYMYISIPYLLSNCLKEFMSYQNVIITLSIGLCVIWILDVITGYFKASRSKEAVTSPHVFSYSLKNRSDIIYLLLCTAVTAAGCLTAYYAKTDFSYKGVLIIVFMYLFRQTPIVAIGLSYLVLALTSSVGAYSLPGFILILMYNGQRGKISRLEKYIFYIIYPAHLMLIFIIRALVL